jgi:hypothetical protein
VWLATGRDGRWTGAAPLLGAAGCVCLAGGLLLRRAVAIAPALALVGGEYALLVAVDAESLDTRAPLVAAGLLASGELAAWSLELRGRVREDAGAWWRRVAFVLGESAAAYAVAVALLAVSQLAEDGGGLALEALGVACLAAGGVALVRLARG